MSRGIYLVVVGLLLLGAAPTAVAAGVEYPIIDGYAFGRSNDAAGTRVGFTATDDDGVALWSEYQRLGGRGVLGPAISNRFQCDDTICQAFQFAVLRWDAGSGQAEVVPVLDQVHQSSRDDLLSQKLNIPPVAGDQSDATVDGGVTSDSALAALAASLGRAWDTDIGVPEVLAQTPIGEVLRGSTGAAVASPNGGAYVVGAGEIAVAAGLVPASALQPAALPDSVAVIPAHLRIPKIGLNRPIVPMDADSDGSLPAPPRPQDVVWYSNSALLGESGTMVMAGHVDWVTGGAAFFHLSDLQPGDDVWVGDSAGEEVQYQVVSVALDSGDSPTVKTALTNSGAGTPKLTLVTCGGPFDVATRTYLERLVVQAQRLN